jgi:alkanesulfonate monooxygenase SsuD/methylene tetrahydromethanopterin reductase-like flavin-dependent oxidoreductase (luciferase family)
VARSLKAGRGANDVKIMPASEFILAATPREALEKKEWVRSLQIGPQQAIAYLEQFWGRELSGYDPDGPLPEIDPVVEETSETRGSGFHGAKARQLADQWRAEAKDRGLSIRAFVSAKTSRVDATFTGSYVEIADRLEDYARTGAVDGFNISPWLVPSGLDEIVNHLVPELQGRGIYPTEYAGTTLREHLSLPVPVRSAEVPDDSADDDGGAGDVRLELAVRSQQL